MTSEKTASILSAQLAPSCFKRVKTPILVRSKVAFQLPLMSKNLTLEKELATIPFIAQEGKVLMPGVVLPLDIQTPLDIYMIQQALSKGRMIGVIQPQCVSGKGRSLYQVGCLGRITTFSEHKDGDKKGGFYVAVKGIKKFNALSFDKKGKEKFLKVRYDSDISENQKGTKEARKQLMRVLPGYLASTLFSLKDMPSLERFQKANDAELIASLTALCPFEGSEKQAILEKNTLAERLNLLTLLLKMRDTSFHRMMDQCH